MGQLSADATQSFEVPSATTDLPVLDNVVIYRGSAVGLSGGYARQLVAADVFVGFAEQKVDNTATGHASGLKTVPVRRFGFVQLSVGSVAVTDTGADVYASDGNTYTLVAGANSFVGKVHRYISSGVAIVAFDTSNP